MHRRGRPQVLRVVLVLVSWFCSFFSLNHLFLMALVGTNVFCAGNRSVPNRFIGVLKSSRWFASILLTFHISSNLLINSFVILVSPPFYLPPFAFISLSPSFFLLPPPFNFFSWEGGPWILPIHLLHCKHLLALKKITLKRGSIFIGHWMRNVKWSSSMVCYYEMEDVKCACFVLQTMIKCFWAHAHGSDSRNWMTFGSL